MDFALLTLVVAILIVRPTDFLTGMEVIPLYAIAIGACVLVSFPRLASVLAPGELKRSPAGAFALGVLGVSLVANFGRGRLDEGLEFATEYGKVVLFLFLVIGVVDTPSRLAAMLKVVVVVTLIPVSMAILHYHGIIDVPNYKVTVEYWGEDPETGENGVTRRLGASGVFADPNDVTEIINVSIVFALGAFVASRSRAVGLLWLLPVPILLYAIHLTRSRGGLLGLMGGLSTLALIKLGGRRALVLGLAAVPCVMTLAGGRQLTLGTGEGTSQARIQLWNAAFDELIHSPVIGVGTQRLRELIGQVTHNSFLHAGAELGVVGGLLFFGVFYYLATRLFRARAAADGLDPDAAALRPFLLAGLASYTINEMSLTHPYTLFTYVVAGLGTAWLRIADRSVPIEGVEATGGLLREVCVWGGFFFTALFLFTKASVRV